MPVLMLFAIILIAGVLLRVGLRCRRRGTTPHCRRCGYNLTGLVSPYCPECGLVLDETEIVYGEPYRRPLLAGIGGLLLVLAVVGAVSGVRRGVNWYHYCPTMLVLRDAQSANQATAVKAWGELRWRLTAGSLSAGQRADLIDLALKMQAPSFPFASTAPSYLGIVADVLAQLYLNRQLTKPQEDQFFKQMVTFQLRVRPQVAAGEEVPYLVQYRGYGPFESYPPGKLWMDFSYGRVCVDQVPTGLDDGDGAHCSSTGCGSGGDNGGRVPSQTPGHHTLSLVATGKVYVGTVLSEAESELCGRVDTPLQASFDVLAAEPNGFVRLTDDPSLAPALHACIIPDLFEGRDAETRYLSVSLKIDAPPVPICFDVLVRVGDGECWLGHIAVRQGAPNVNYDLSGCGMASPVEKCDIILRSSPESARKTVDLTEIWSGELVYKDVLVKVARGLATQPTTTGSPTPEPD